MLKHVCTSKKCSTINKIKKKTSDCKKKLFTVFRTRINAVSCLCCIYDVLTPHYVNYSQFCKKQSQNSSAEMWGQASE